MEWRRYEGLWVGIVSRHDLIYFKLCAAADDVGVSSVHFQDLLALLPSDAELNEAGNWIRKQDPTPGFAGIVSEVIRHAREHRDRAR